MDDFTTNIPTPEKFLGEELLSKKLDQDEMRSAESVLAQARAEFPENLEKQASFIKEYVEHTLPGLVSANRSEHTAKVVLDAKIPKYKKICSVIVETLYPEHSQEEGAVPYSQLNEYDFEFSNSDILDVIRSEFSRRALQKLEAAGIVLTEEERERLNPSAYHPSAVGYSNGRFSFTSATNTVFQDTDKSVKFHYISEEIRNEIKAENPNLFKKRKL